MKNKRLLFGFVAIFLAVLLVFVGIPLINRKYNRTVSVVRIAKTVEKGTVIQTEQLETVTMNAAGLPEVILKNTEEIVGKYALVDMVSGDFVLPTKLSSFKQEDTSVFSSLSDGTVAVTISAPNLAGTLANQIRTGDIIRIYQLSGGTLYEYYELQYLKIYGITNANGTNVEEVTGDESRMASTYTFVVTEKQAEKLIALNHDGTLHFVLISRGEPNRAEYLLWKQSALLQKTAETGFSKDTFDYAAWEAAWEKENPPTAEITAESTEEMTDGQ